MCYLLYSFFFFFWWQVRFLYIWIEKNSPMTKSCAGISLRFINIKMSLKKCMGSSFLLSPKNKKIWKHITTWENDLSCTTKETVIAANAAFHLVHCVYIIIKWRYIDMACNQEHTRNNTSRLWSHDKALVSHWSKRTLPANNNTIWLSINLPNFNENTTKN